MVPCSWSLVLLGKWCILYHLITSPMWCILYHLITSLLPATAQCLDLSQNQRQPRVGQDHDQGRGKPLLKLGIILPQTQWLTKIRSYLNIISNSLEDLDRVG